MKFCPECGSNVEGTKFCPECGYKIESKKQDTSEEVLTVQSTQAVSGTQTTTNLSENVLWEGKQSILFGLNDKLRYKATDSIELKMKEDRYQITNYVVRIFHESTTTTQEEIINFEDVKDCKIKQGLKEKIQGIGDLVVFLMNGSEKIMKGIKDPETPKTIIMQKALEFQRSRNIQYRKEL
ncbi:TPA: PH domain-containing protein [Enterococcus hirae]